MKDTRLSDLLTGAAILGMGIMSVVMSAALPSASMGLGSGGFPTVIGWCMIVLGAMQIVLTARKGFSGIKVKVNFSSLWPSLAVAALCLIYYLLLRKVGFVLLTPLLLFGVMRIFHYKKVIPAIIISVVTTAVIYLMFNKLFMIFLPECRLF